MNALVGIRNTKRGLAAALAASTLLAVAGFAGTGCAVAQQDPSSDAEDTSTTTDDALSGDDAVSRAEEWVHAKLHYCQAPNHHRDWDQACSSFCNRQDNAAWDPYRSDCSGLVSWAWKLPAPGRVTTEFAPFQDDITKTIDAIDLRPGDAVNNTDHVMLFKEWKVKGKEAVFIEEPGCSVAIPYAHEFTSSVSISGSSIHVTYNGMSFHAIRYTKLKAGPPTPVPAKPKACAALEPGQGLRKGQSVKSCDGRFDLVLQTDGNVVVYEGKKPLWASHTVGKDSYALIMQTDGNLVLYDPHSEPLWAAGTWGHDGAHADLQDDGNLVIYKNGKALWATHTSGH